MNLHNLPKQKERIESDRRVGRGRRSGKGKTSGHGVKGQRVRNRLKLRRLQIFKQFPMVRGKREFGRDWSESPYIVKLTDCNAIDSESIDRKVLLSNGLIGDEENRTIKVLGNGSLDKPMTFSGEFLFSKNARRKIEDAGGTITEES